MKKFAALMIALPLSILWAVRPLCAHDHDNNPPGPRGGPGTNWENPPGPAGGPGASPDRHPYYWHHHHFCENHPHHAGCVDHDDNPPGPVGGRGTNWENPPGPAGGPGTSPNRT
jgi:hypothetical protein